jgi:hypothetical protein
MPYTFLPPPINSTLHCLKGKGISKIGLPYLLLWLYLKDKMYSVSSKQNYTKLDNPLT